MRVAGNGVADSIPACFDYLHRSPRHDSGEIGRQGSLTIYAGVRFAGRGFGGRARDSPPVIQDSRNSLDLAGVLDGPQQEFVILRAIVTLVQPAKTIQERALEYHEMADIVTRKKQVRRPVRLKECIVAATALIYLVFVGIEKIDIRILIDGPDHLP